MVTEEEYNVNSLEGRVIQKEIFILHILKPLNMHICEVHKF
jgi:hypothetical protein